MRMKLQIITSLRIRVTLFTAELRESKKINYATIFIHKHIKPSFTLLFLTSEQSCSRQAGQQLCSGCRNSPITPTETNSFFLAVCPKKKKKCCWIFSLFSLSGSLMDASEREHAVSQCCRASVLSFINISIIIMQMKSIKIII